LSSNTPKIVVQHQQQIAPIAVVLADEFIARPSGNASAMVEVAVERLVRLDGLFQNLMARF